MKPIVVKGAGDLATGTIVKLVKAGYRVVATDLPSPTVIRRTVSLAEAVFSETMTVEEVEGVHCKSLEAVAQCLESGRVPIFTGTWEEVLGFIEPEIVIEATLSKHNTGLSIELAPFVIALGPGYEAGRDCHCVIETMRGHELGRVIELGRALPNTGIPGDIGGYSTERVIRAGTHGVWKPCKAIGDQVAIGTYIGYTVNEDGEEVPSVTTIAGILRGQLHEGLPVFQGMKVADVDPRAKVDHCFSISDKARAIAGGVLECVCGYEHRR